MKMQHVFFDLDNTLWDHRRNAYLTIKDLFEDQEINSKYNIDFEEFHSVYHDINEDLWEKIRDGIVGKEYLREHRFYDSFKHFGVENKELSNYFEENFLDNIVGYNELVEGAEDILEYLKAKNYKLHIISNGFQDVTERKCTLSGIAPYFETITSADSIGVRKPNPKIFEYSLGLSEAKKEESILIGDDWIADAMGAKNFGMDSIFFDVYKEDKKEAGLKAITHLQQIKEYL
ncbi:MULTISPECIES: YjjG family noncanonical pyrimidine nucleotidase [Chryseobacterium]|jgi:putative hydrolase of the HAD superfamily|uniref:Hydrolase of the HAD superfamily n=1 Tax=Chryseobacterium rhizosphaerae TaxID=395937 RepID=A0AAE4C463_9FLAO|nr:MULTISPECIES: YjjG family noncanonical pyrimidine nucleotidase [Chryseobacterium]MBL3549405.1 YjjG family noncanonical pyrimidine nucleotidase [Chryseobacterium sp. KMC2]MDR6526355.1 putative hydrolase of the HAD superfamily [Chryseobacterium rhizosphaerae]REC74291.1 noncanonical pyrimidine nucleotidase, YjjG family [Chryseobacterium rhizosphaerae]SMC93387.1 putative hydrolase of the HAD superfamily [Chryseobacterium sp. YR221]